MQSHNRKYNEIKNKATFCQAFEQKMGKNMACEETGKREGTGE